MTINRQLSDSSFDDSDLDVRVRGTKHVVDIVVRRQDESQCRVKLLFSPSVAEGKESFIFTTSAHSLTHSLCSAHAYLYIQFIIPSFHDADCLVSECGGVPYVCSSHSYNGTHTYIHTIHVCIGLSALRLQMGTLYCRLSSDAVHYVH